MQEAVQDGGGDDRTSEHLAPFSDAAGRFGAYRASRIGHLSAPGLELSVEIVDVPQCPGKEEVLPDITEGRIRDLALFNLAIDSKLRGCGLVRLKVADVYAAGQVKERTSIMQSKTSLRETDAADSPVARLARVLADWGAARSAPLATLSFAGHSSDSGGDE